MQTKTCFRCGATKSTSEFFKSSHNTDGFRSSCKRCQFYSRKVLVPPSVVNIADEIWRGVVGLETMYVISNLGRVKSLNFRGSGREGLLKQNLRGGGYPAISFRLKGKTLGVAVHKLVLEAFRGNAPEGHVCDHIDRNRTNNNVNNLRWVTYADNNKNKVPHKNSSSKFKGVHFDKATEKWVAHTVDSGTTVYIGSFILEVDAAIAYDKAITLAWGNTAVTNKQLGLY